MSNGESSSGNHQLSAVERTYAQVLLELADEAGVLDEIADESQQLEELIRTDIDLRRLLESKVLAVAERSGVLENIFHGRIHDLLYRFIQVVNQKDRLDELGRVMLAFAKLLDEKRGLIEVDAYVASRLDEGLAQQVASRIGQAFDSTAIVHQYVDPSLIGGLKIRVADRLIDGSVVAQLRRIQEKIITSGREKAREQVAAMEE